MSPEEKKDNEYKSEADILTKSEKHNIKVQLEFHSQRVMGSWSGS